MDIIGQHLGHLRNGEPILKPVYQHGDGTFGRPKHIEPEALRRRSRACSATTRRSSARSSTCASTSRRRRTLRREWKIKRDTTQARLHRAGGARRPRSPRARLRGLHPPAEVARRPRRLLPARRRAGPRPPRRRADAARGPAASPTSRLDADGERRHHASRSAPARCVPDDPRQRRSRRAAPRSKRRSGRRCTSRSHLRTERLGEFADRRRRLAPLRVAGDRAGADPVPPRHGEGRPSRSAATTPRGGASPATCPRRRSAPVAARPRSGAAADAQARPAAHA